MKHRQEQRYNWCHFEERNLWFQLGGDCECMVGSIVRANSWRGHVFNYSTLSMNEVGVERKKVSQMA